MVWHNQESYATNGALHANKYIKPEMTQIPTVDEIAARVQSATFSAL